MSVETRLHAASEAGRRSRPALLAAIGGFALLTVVAAQVRVPLPFTPVPVTLQVFTVLLAGYVLGPGAGAASQALYLGLGAVGLPVFAGGGLFGFTGGYLLAFPVAAWLAGVAVARRSGAAGRIGAGLVALAVIHASGALWLAAAAPMAPDFPGGLFTWSLLPFLGLDVVKVLVAERLSRPRVRVA